MRILFSVTRADFFGGSSTHVNDLCARLREEGHDVLVLIGGEGPVADRIRLRGTKVVAMRYLQREVSATQDPLCLCEYISEILKFRPDVVSCHTSKAGFLGRIAADICRVPVVYLPHCWSFVDGFPKADFYMWAERIGALWGTGVIAVSEDERQQALAKNVSSPGGVLTIVNGMPDKGSLGRATPEAHPPRLVMIGRFEAQKDQTTLLDALAALKHLPWTLSLIGNGPLEDDSKAQARRLGIADRVSYLGYRQDIIDQLANAQIYLLISNWEGFARSIIEAMRAGLPVVASDVGGAREAVFDDKTGFLVARGDVPGVTEALRRLIAEPALRKRLGDGARGWYENNLTFEIMFAKYRAVYSRLAAFNVV